MEAREPDPNPSVAVSTQPASPARSFNWPAWTTGAVGVAALGTGVTFMILGEMDHQDVANSTNVDEAQALIDSGDTKKLVGYITAGVGGAAVITGVVLLVTGIGSHEIERAPATAFSFTPLQGGGFVSLRGRF